MLYQKQYELRDQEWFLKENYSEIYREFLEREIKIFSTYFTLENSI